MNFKSEMQDYYKLLTWDERHKKMHKILSQLERIQKPNNPVTSLNMAEAIIEYCLLIENNEERLLQYDRALKLLHNTSRILKQKNQIRQILRSYHLECLIKYHTVKYTDEEASIRDIFNLGGKIIEMATNKKHQNAKNNDYYSLGFVWRAYGLVLQLIDKLKDLSLSQKHDMLENAKRLAHKAVELSRGTKNRHSEVLSAYIFAFIEELPKRMLKGDRATTEEDFVKFMHPYEVLFEIAHVYGSIEFEYLALLNHIRLKIHRIIYAAGVSERKRKIFNELLGDCKKLEEYENLIHRPHIHFYR